ncbi:hypothetical protein [Nisaea nitritireducens]|uniref:hypothetical protein n=1 Tax=Nisaea nitritireducens TaxID=568392 RepID=UPI0018662B57|nr:hypothetical protein [Nisaea nitritireducens]
MSIVQFHWGSGRERQPQGWSTQETAEFYRIADIMARAGLRVEIDQGETDEGDPWLVFVRPETDDVVAHFARIDGFFVSVSSLTQDIYRGRDVRSVINQMLERHPLMVPRSEEGGKLFLHPSVVLTAFVAAAFVMAIDEARAQTLEDVLAKAVTPSDGDASPFGASDKSVEDAPQVEILGARMEAVGEDTTGYNQAALLGAVMMAYSLMSQEVESLNLNNVWDDRSAVTVDGHELVPNLDPVFVADENTFHGDDAPAESFIRNKPAGAIVADTAGESGAENAHQENTVLATNHWPAFMQHADEGPVAVEKTATLQEKLADFIVLRGEAAEDRLQDIPQEGFDKEPSADAVETVHPEGGDLTSLSAIAREAFEVVSLWKEDSGSLGLGNIGISMDSRGELFTVGVLSGDVVVGTILRSATEISMDDGDASETAVPGDVEKEAASPPSYREEKIVVQEPPADPIVGHYLGREGVSLSSAIDVLFYDGGDFTVSGFELGKDLLWFFLTPDQISASQSEIVNGDDLMISFGGVGTLTFVDVLSGSAAAELI